MFSEWTDSRAASKTLEDVIRKQWAVPSSHNPPTWGAYVCVCVCISVSVPNLMLSVTLHSLGYEKHPLLLPLRQMFCFFFFSCSSASIQYSKIIPTYSADCPKNLCSSMFYKKLSVLTKHCCI